MKKQLLIFFLLALPACATITADADQVLTINTNPAGAECVISNSLGRYSINSTPNTITVQRAYEPLDVMCVLTGYAPAHSMIEAKTRGRAYGNILLLGFPAFVDMSTGKGYEYDPEEITLELRPANAAPANVLPTGPVLRPR